MEKELLSIINNFSKVKILCIGDIMLDRFVHGKVERISPEAPVPVFQFVQERQMLGGAGNVVANLCTLGAQTYFIGMIGRDQFGENVTDLLSRIKADYYMLKSKVRPTIMKARFIAGNNHIMRLDQEKIMPMTSLEERELLVVLEKRIPKADIVLLSDYAKGLFSQSFTNQLIELCHKFDKKVLVDPKRRDYQKYMGATLIKPNRRELEMVADVTFDTSSPDFLKDVIKVGREILHRYQIENMIVTLSEKGMVYVPSNEEEECVYIPTYAKEVFDVSGAGDTSLAVLGMALASGASIKDAMELANAAAGIVVGKLGTATLTADELIDYLLERDA